MSKNYKRLVNLRKISNLFEELGSLDNDVACSLGQNVNFHFSIKHSNLSTNHFRVSTKPSKNNP